MSVEWRTYREPVDDIAPVVRRWTTHSLALLDKTEISGTHQTPPFNKAVGLYSGRTWSSGDGLPNKHVAKEPILLYLTTPRSGGRRVAWAADNFTLPRVTRDGTALIVPTQLAFLNEEERRVVAEPVGRGVFKVPAGYNQIGPIDISRSFDVQWLDRFVENIDDDTLTESEKYDTAVAAFEDRFGREAAGGLGHYTYDPYHGVLYAESLSGEPLDASILVELIVQPENSWLHKAEALPTGTHYITPQGINTAGDVIARFSVEHSANVEDARRYILPAPASKRHAADHGHFDGDHLSDAHLWIIETDADEDRVRKEARRTLPAGSIIDVRKLNSESQT